MDVEAVDRDEVIQQAIDTGLPRADRARRLIRLPRAVVHQHFVDRPDREACVAWRRRQDLRWSDFGIEQRMAAGGDLVVERADELVGSSEDRRGRPNPGTAAATATTTIDAGTATIRTTGLESRKRPARRGLLELPARHARGPGLREPWRLSGR